MYDNNKVYEHSKTYLLKQYITQLEVAIDCLTKNIIKKLFNRLPFVKKSIKV